MLISKTIISLKIRFFKARLRENFRYSVFRAFIKREDRASICLASLQEIQPVSFRCGVCAFMRVNASTPQFFELNQAEKSKSPLSYLMDGVGNLVRKKRRARAANQYAVFY